MPSVALAKLNCPVDGSPLAAIPGSHLNWCAKCRGMWIARRGVYAHFGRSVRAVSRDASAASGKRCPVDNMPLMLVDQEQMPGALICAQCRGVWIGLQRYPMPVAAMLPSMRRRLARIKAQGQPKEGKKPPAVAGVARPVVAAPPPASPRPQQAPQPQRPKPRPAAQPPRMPPLRAQGQPPDLDEVMRKFDQGLKEVYERTPMAKPDWSWMKLLGGRRWMVVAALIWFAIQAFGLEVVLVVGGLLVFAWFRASSLSKASRRNAA